MTGNRYGPSAAVVPSQPHPLGGPCCAIGLYLPSIPTYTAVPLSLHPSGKAHRQNGKRLEQGSSAARATPTRFSRFFQRFSIRYPCTVATRAAYRCTDRQDASPTGCFTIRTQYTPNTLLLLLLHYAIQAMHRRTGQRTGRQNTHSVLDAWFADRARFFVRQTDGFLDGFCFSKRLFDDSKCS